MPTCVSVGWWEKWVLGIKTLEKTWGSSLSSISAKACPGFPQCWNLGHSKKDNAGMRSFCFFISAFPKGLLTQGDRWWPVTKIRKSTPCCLGSRSHICHSQGFLLSGNFLPVGLAWLLRGQTQGHRRDIILNHSDGKGKDKKRRENEPSMTEAWLIINLDSDRNVKNREGKEKATL